MDQSTTSSVPVPEGITVSLRSHYGERPCKEISVDFAPVIMHLDRLGGEVTVEAQSVWLSWHFEQQQRSPLSPFGEPDLELAVKLLGELTMANPYIDQMHTKGKRIDLRVVDQTIIVYDPSSGQPTKTIPIE